MSHPYFVIFNSDIVSSKLGPPSTTDMSDQDNFRQETWYCDDKLVASRKEHTSWRPLKENKYQGLGILIN